MTSENKRLSAAVLQKNGATTSCPEKESTLFLELLQPM